jgi:transketolase
MRKQFPKTIEKLMKKNKKIFCLLGDIGVFSFKNIFNKYKNRILNMSTMEQSMIGFGAGLSKAGYIPVIHTIAPFLVLRALDQIKIDFVYNKLSCNIVSVGASNDYAKLGATHHCFEDVSILSNYSDINIFTPSNSAEFHNLLQKNYNNKSVNYFRITESNRKNNINKNSFIGNKNKNNILIIVGNSIDEKLKKNTNFDIYYINTISKNMNFNFVKRYKKITIVEPFFGNVIERLIRKKKYLKKEILTIGYNQTILHKYGSKIEQDSYLGFDDLSIIKKINRFNA